MMVMIIIIILVLINYFLLLFDLISSPTLRCFGWMMILIPQLVPADKRHNTFIGTRALPSMLLAMTLNDVMYSYGILRVRKSSENKPEYAMHKTQYLSCSLVCFFYFICQVFVPLYFFRLQFNDVLLPRYHNVYQDSFITDLVHMLCVISCVSRAIAL